MKLRSNVSEIFMKLTFPKSRFYVFFWKNTKKSDIYEKLLLKHCSRSEIRCNFLLSHCVISKQNLNFALYEIKQYFECTILSVAK